MPAHVFLAFLYFHQRNSAGDRRYFVRVETIYNARLVCRVSSHPPYIFPSCRKSARNPREDLSRVARYPARRKIFKMPRIPYSYNSQILRIKIQAHYSSSWKRNFYFIIFFNIITIIRYPLCKKKKKNDSE